jgi:hypothetical protein
MKKAFFSQGPGVTLNRKDVKTLRERGCCDFDFRDINGTLRVSVCENEIPPMNMCEKGIYVRRYPEKISPYDYKGRQLWIIQLSKSRIEKLISDAKTNFDKHETIISRCKYDRMSVSYFDG